MNYFFPLPPSGKLMAYDTDGDGDFDVEDAKVLLGKSSFICLCCLLLWLMWFTVVLRCFSSELQPVSRCVWTQLQQAGLEVSGSKNSRVSDLLPERWKMCSVNVHGESESHQMSKPNACHFFWGLLSFKTHWRHQIQYKYTTIQYNDSALLHCNAIREVHFCDVHTFLTAQSAVCKTQGAPRCLF